MGFAELSGVNLLTSGTDLAFAGDTVLPDLSETNLTWHEAFAATNEDWGGFHVHVWIGYKGFIAIAIGASGSETYIAQLPVHGRTKLKNEFYIPVPVPAGTRVSVAVTCKNIRDVQVQVIGAPATGFAAMPPYTQLVSGPYSLATSADDYVRGVYLDAGILANTRSAWTEISHAGSGYGLSGDSTDDVYAYLGFVVDYAYAGNSVPQQFIVDISVGASGAEDANIIVDGFLVSNLAWGTPHPGVLWIPWGRPAGDRISARVQSDSVDPDRNTVDVLMLGLK